MSSSIHASGEDPCKVGRSMQGGGGGKGKGLPTITGDHA